MLMHAESVYLHCFFFAFPPLLDLVRNTKYNKGAQFRLFYHLKAWKGNGKKKAAKSTFKIRLALPSMFPGPR